MVPHVILTSEENLYVYVPQDGLAIHVKQILMSVNQLLVRMLVHVSTRSTLSRVSVQVDGKVYSAMKMLMIATQTHVCMEEVVLIEGLTNIYVYVILDSLVITVKQFWTYVTVVHVRMVYVSVLLTPIHVSVILVGLDKTVN